MLIFKIVVMKRREWLIPVSNEWACLFKNIVFSDKIKLIM